MKPHLVRRRSLLFFSAVAGVTLAACEDTRVKQLDTGITRDSAVSVIAHGLPAGAPSDSFPNVYTREQFLTKGQNIEVLYFTPDNEKLKVKSGVRISDTINFKRLTPLVFRDNRLIGRGWNFWDSVSKANNIPLKKH
ncbi:MAG TPA: hypothetical protein VI259_18600 [Gemmatimonadaceae bacterium]